MSSVKLERPDLSLITRLRFSDIDDFSDSLSDMSEDGKQLIGSATSRLP